MAEQLDPIAERAFAIAIDTHRAGELLDALINGGSCTVDPDGALIIVDADVIEAMRVEDVERASATHAVSILRKMVDPEAEGGDGGGFRCLLTAEQSRGGPYLTVDVGMISLTEGEAAWLNEQGWLRA